MMSILKLRYWILNNGFDYQLECLIVSIVLIFFLHAQPAIGYEVIDSLQIHGFFSQGYVITSDNNFYGKSDDNGTFDFREIGINSSYQPFPYLQFSLQILSRFAGEVDDGDLRLDYGTIDWTLVDRDTTQWGLRLGRGKVPFGLYNETRDVAFTRPSIFLSQSIYFDRTRDLAISADGLYLYGEYRTDRGNFFLKLAGGRPKVKDKEIENSFLGTNFPGHLDSDEAYSEQLIYEYNNGLIRLALTGTQLNIFYDPSLSSPVDIDSGSIRFKPYIISAQFNQEKWSLSAEYALRRIEYKNFRFPAEINRTIEGESYYIQGTHRLCKDLSAVARYDILYTNKDDRNGKESERKGHPYYSFFAKDLTFGLRWDITRSLMLQGEYHYVNGTAWLATGDNSDLYETQRYWSLFAILLSYYF
ncbi:MAG: hypothetical protein SWO11_03230 [Thermodesulfobacteriota bacterium]|nr:hypothetical protein [Thermodesulfobacteriota bacterium]